MSDFLSANTGLTHPHERTFNVRGADGSHELQACRVVEVIERHAGTCQDFQTRRLLLSAATDLIEKIISEHQVPGPPRLDD